MKKALGKIITSTLFIISCLSANSTLATYELSSNKDTAYIKEAVQIKLIAKQKDKTDVMFFFLEPKKSDNYKIVLLNKEANELAYHYKQTTFTYLLFPLKSKKIKVNFDFTIKVASDEAVAQVFQGSRDNVKWIETTNTKVDLAPVVINVKKLHDDVELVGDFTITSELKSDSIDSYESANITYHLIGTGYDSFNISPIQSIKNAKVFPDVTKHYDNATPDGYELHREFNYALISDHDFIIKQQSIPCYSPKQKKYYTLTTPEYFVNVKIMDVDTLIDKTDFPKNENNFVNFKTATTYMLIFFAGFLSAKFAPPNFSMKKTKYKDIRESKNAKELLYVMMHSYYKYEFKEYYESLNDIAYNNADKRKFKTIKKLILKKLETMS